MRDSIILGKFLGQSDHRQHIASTEELKACYQRITQLEGVLGECQDYFEARADAEYFPDRASPVGNLEMTMLCQIDEVLP